ncbi:28615_t:CDS:2, partial [Racocetra persica]
MNIKNVDMETKKNGKQLEKILKNDEFEDAFDELQFEDLKKDDEPKAKQKIKINNPVNTIRLIDAIKSKLYYMINVYYEDLELDGLVTLLLDPH